MVINMKNKRWTDYVLLFAGLFISGIGVAVTKKGELGVSPISSVANILTLAVPRLTLGNWLIIWNCILILGQIIILRKEFKVFQFLQVPLSFLFGYFTDIGTLMISNVNTDIYIARLFCALFGTIILGLGISMTVHADIIMNSGEAFVKAVSDKTKIEFGNVKIVFDILCVVISLILSLVLFQGSIRGTREGTIIAALLTGVFVKCFSRVFKISRMN